MRTEQTPKYETNVSDERLDVILSNECGAPPGLATSRFRRLANEIADRDERIARLEGALETAARFHGIDIDVLCEQRVAAALEYPHSRTVGTSHL